MSKLRALILIPFLACFSLVASGQTSTTALQTETPIERQLGPSQVHEFTLNLEENSYIQLVVQQRGIDVIVKVLSPDHKILGEFDSPNGGEGPEHVSFVAAVAGVYRVHVSPLNVQDATTGRYVIKILELRQANEQELKAYKNLEVAKARGIALLTEIEGLAPQIKSAQTRIRAQVQGARLLWEVDEKRASKLLSDAIAGLKEFLASAEPDDEYSQRVAAISELRYGIVELLAAHDPDAALNFLDSTRRPADAPGNQHERLIQENILQLTIADRISQKDPARALQIAKRSLKSRLSSSLIGTISQLWRQNPEMAAELAREVATRLISSKLLESPETAGLAISVLRFYRRSGQRFEGAPVNENAAKVVLIPEDQYKELLQKMLREALSYRLPATLHSHTPEREAAWALLNALRAMGPGVESIMGGAEAAVQKKLAELSSPNESNVVVQQKYHNLIKDGSVDTSLEAIEKAPPELKEQLYLLLANREVNNGDFARARQIINDHITNPHQRRQTLANIDQQEVHRAINTGKIEDALRKIAKFRNSRVRAEHLSQWIHQIGPGLKRAAAMNFLEQARSLLDSPLQAQNQEEMQALLEIARAFSRYDSKRSFEILDPLIDQFNELSAAARTMEGFGSEYYEDEELDLNNGSSVAAIASQIARVLGTLALTSFDRAKATSDRIRLPEVRLRIYLDIASQTIVGAK